MYCQMLSFHIFVLCSLSGTLQAGTVLDELSGKAEYSTFLGWLSKDTKDSLNDSTVLVTVFIPTNDACQNFKSEHPEISDNNNWLESIAEHSVEELKERRSLDVGTSPHINRLWCSGRDTWTYINNAKSVSSKVASNGQIHTLDAVIYPLGLAGTLREVIDFEPKYSGLKSMLAIATEAHDVLDNVTAEFTVFSPNADVVTEDIKAMSSSQLLLVIRRHIVRGQVIFSTILKNQKTSLQTLQQDATIEVKVIHNKDRPIVCVGSGGYWSMVESVDVSTSNGVIHVINGILGRASGSNLCHSLDYERVLHDWIVPILTTGGVLLLIVIITYVILFMADRRPSTNRRRETACRPNQQCLIGLQNIPPGSQEEHGEAPVTELLNELDEQDDLH